MSGLIAEAKAIAVLEACRARGILLATAESCTGGLIVASLTDIGGSSDVVDRGFITYSNEAKHAMLGIPMEVIAAHGAVSEEVALAMAAGALQHSRAGIAVAVTGVAGPGRRKSRLVSSGSVSLSRGRRRRLCGMFFPITGARASGKTPSKRRSIWC